MDDARLRWRDAIAPALIGILGVVELASLDADGRVAAGTAELLACCLLVLRRRWPLLSCTLAIVLCTLPPWLGPAINDVSTPILILALALYSLARWVADYRGLIGIGVAWLALGLDYLIVDTRDHDITDVFFVTVLVVPPYVFGRITRRMADYNGALEREQGLVRSAAVRDERDRIARELHDVIAHSVSAMVVQVEVAQDLVERDPARAHEVLESAAGTGRRALAETGRLLHVIRDSADELGLAPVPGLADLPVLLEEYRQRGLSIELRGEAPTTLPAAVDVSAYRIMAEALTNAERYAGSPVVELELRVDVDTLVIRSANEDSGRTGAGSGLGLVGMAERVSLLGGTMTTSDVGGRFVLEVRLPVRTGVQEPA